MQAIVLVGGEGTRLRPLTTHVPKPALTLVDRPFLAYMVEWLAGYGVDEIVLACGFLPDVLREELGEHEHGGVRLTYVAEPERRGTGGAIRFAADSLGERLGERFLALNGDVLADLDLGALLQSHQERGARASLALHAVADSSPYGLVTTDPGGAVLEFKEKTGEAVPGEINAGAYVLERSVLDLIPPGAEVSIEREVFPRLVGDGLCALPLEGYWMDFGTPERYLQATWDILEGRVATQVRPTAPGLFVDAGAEVDPAAVVGPRAVVGAGCRVDSGATITESVLLEGSSVGAGARVGESSILAAVTVAAGATVNDSVLSRVEVIGQDEDVTDPAEADGAAAAMIDDVLGIPDQLRDALWRVESARLEAAEAEGLLVCGMGGSAIGGDLAAAALGSRLRRPLVVARGYVLPSWVGERWTVLCCSYSGETEETVSCFEAAGELGARRLVASTGGPLVARAREAGVPVVGLPGIFQPRAAVAYFFTVVAEVAALSGVAPRIATEIEAAAGFLGGELEQLKHQAAEIAAQLEGRIPVIYGAELTAPVARRWKTQANENAKVPAFFLELPEADHNDICGWAVGAREHSFSAVFLEDRDANPRVGERFRLTAEAVAETGAPVVRVETAGETPTARLLWTAMLGDLVSLELASRGGVDPLAVEAIDCLKQALGPVR